MSDFDFEGVFTPELLNGVTITGRLEIDRFLLYMRACDVAVNLRHPTAGETSGTVIRLLGLGKPVVVSNTGAFAEIPDGCCAKVDLDATEEELLTTYLLALARDPALRRRLGENARRHVAAHHTLAGSARAYADFVRETVASRPALPRAVPPLAPYPPEDVLADLAGAVAAAAVDLGMGEADDDLLRELAAMLVDLGWSGAAGRGAA